MTRNPALLIIGLLMLLGGTIGAFAAKDAADSQAFIDQFAASLAGRMIEASPDYTGMWVGIIVAALGVVAVIIYVAQRTNAPAPPVEHVTDSIG